MGRVAHAAIILQVNSSGPGVDTLNDFGADSNAYVVAYTIVFSFTTTPTENLILTVKSNNLGQYMRVGRNQSVDPNSSGNVNPYSAIVQRASTDPVGNYGAGSIYNAQNSIASPGGIQMLLPYQAAEGQFTYTYLVRVSAPRNPKLFSGAYTDSIQVNLVAAP